VFQVSLWEEISVYDQIVITNLKGEEMNIKQSFT